MVKRKKHCIPISIHTLRVEGDVNAVSAVLGNMISIHTLRVEGDFFCPCGFCKVRFISIHTLRVEGDRKAWVHPHTRRYFYPHPPGGGRPVVCASKTCKRKFLSTPSGWRATCPRKLNGYSRIYFYPRPPGGGRRLCHSPAQPNVYFYPRPPGGGRLVILRAGFGSANISIHALRVEGDISVP